MSDFSIPWDLLLGHEIDFLTSREIDRLPSGISFGRELSIDDLRDVMALLLSLRRRIPNAEENHINFAIGDCGVASEKWFGKDLSETLTRQIVEWFPKRDKLLLFAASVLIHIQQVERLIKVCCSTIGAGLTVEDLLSNNRTAQRATMGRLKGELQNRGLFTQGFEEEMQQFVKDRNSFVHSLWTVELPEMLKNHPDRDPMVLCGQFLSNLFNQAQRFERVFKGLVSSLGGELPVPLSTGFGESTQWVRYSSEFEEVRALLPKSAER